MGFARFTAHIEHGIAGSVPLLPFDDPIINLLGCPCWDRV
jgi:hypothetical protein